MFLYAACTIRLDKLLHALFQLLPLLSISFATTSSRYQLRKHADIFHTLGHAEKGEIRVNTFGLRIIHEEVCLHRFLLVGTTLTSAAEQSNKGSYFVLSGEHILLAMLVCGEVLLWLCVQLCDLGLLGSGRFRAIWGCRFFRCFIFARADFGARREVWFVLLDPFVLISMPILYLNDRTIMIIKSITWVCC